MTLKPFYFFSGHGALQFILALHEHEIHGRVHLPPIEPDIIRLLWSLYSQNRFESHKKSYQDAVVVLIRYHATLAEVAYLASSDEKLHAIHTRSLVRRQGASSTWKLGSNPPGATAAEASSQWLRRPHNRTRQSAVVGTDCLAHGAWHG